tara:strand:- start:11371 stop:12309 length:939 start_codon:yes stop_codon:yes gene_type:complete
MSLVSIIIATYNRANFIQETLLSIANQNYTEFECIVIDDGSCDDTKFIVERLITLDPRFKYFPRPEDVPKGANYCRNYGYSLSSGAFIKFFDSDDLMLPDHLLVSVNCLQKGNYDFVVGDCINFDETGVLKRPYEIDRNNYNLTAIDFTMFNTAWITNDLLVKRGFADQLEFKGGIRDQASEYQYNIKLLLLTQNGFLINQILSKRRIHEDGFVVKAKKRPVWFDQMNAELFYYTAKYLDDLAPKKLLIWLLDEHLKLSYKLARIKKVPENIIGATGLLFTLKGFKGLLYPLAIVMTFITRKGYKFIRFIRK